MRKHRTSYFHLVAIILLVSVLSLSCESKGGGKSIDNDLPEYVHDGREEHASIEFEADFVDLGTIRHGEVITYTFEFSNTGNIPLLIKDIIAGCGCTKTKLSKEILKPSEKAMLEVVFDSKGWYGTQFKSVTLVSNAITPKRSVTLKVNVVK